MTKLRQRFNQSAKWVLIVLCAPAFYGGAQWLIYSTGWSARIIASGSPLWLDNAILLLCLAPSALWAGGRILLRQSPAEQWTHGERRRRVTWRVVFTFGVVVALSLVLMIVVGGFVSCYMGDCF